MPRRFPRIAAYHCGPFRLAGVLRGPGRIGTGCGAVSTGEVGVLNYRRRASDQTALNCHRALRHVGLPVSAYLPLNAIPWFDGTADRASIEEGAMLNADLIARHAITRVVLCGAEAHRAEPHLAARLGPEMRFVRLPHPGTQGLNAHARRHGLAGIEAAREALFDGFARALAD
ncbi:MAG: hypothetical protein ACFBWO_03310 [Paracoccaceae bacterium]